MEVSVHSNVIQLRRPAECPPAPEIHDGQNWLQERPDMTQPASIITRMAEDIAVMRREFPEDPLDLTHKGWTLAQVSRYGNAARRAHEDALKGRPVRQDNRLTELPPEPAVA